LLRGEYDDNVLLVEGSGRCWATRKWQRNSAEKVQGSGAEKPKFLGLTPRLTVVRGRPNGSEPPHQNVGCWADKTLLLPRADQPRHLPSSVSQGRSRIHETFNCPFPRSDHSTALLGELCVSAQLPLSPLPLPGSRSISEARRARGCNSPVPNPAFVFINWCRGLAGRVVSSLRVFSPSPIPTISVSSCQDSAQ
jgi:hypothetical protein